MDEMEHRGYHPNPIWRDANYRGKNLGYQKDWCDQDLIEIWANQNPIYPEHNKFYLQECINNLVEKGIIIDV